MAARSIGESRVLDASLLITIPASDCKPDIGQVQCWNIAGKRDWRRRATRQPWSPRVHTIVLGVVNTLHILSLHSVFYPAVRSRHDVFIFYVVYSLLQACEHVPVLEQCSRSAAFHFCHLLVSATREIFKITCLYLLDPVAVAVGL